MRVSIRIDRRQMRESIEGQQDFDVGRRQVGVWVMRRTFLSGNRSQPASHACALRSRNRQTVRFIDRLRLEDSNLDGVYACSRGGAVVEDQLLWMRENQQAGQKAAPDAITSS